jgi:hypothetical protein
MRSVFERAIPKEDRQIDIVPPIEHVREIQAT